jgi:HlyD family secretion protein
MVGSDRRRGLILLAVALAVGVGIAMRGLPGGTATAAAPVGLTATRGDLTVTVGGVGQIVQAGQSTQPPPTTGTTTPTVETPGFSVFPQASGQLTAFLVQPGQHAAAGQPVALLNDGGLAAAGINQAQVDVSTAKLELLQKRTSDPLKGIPPTPAEFAAGRASVISARARLARLLSPPRPADVSAARLEFKRAQADLQTTLGGTPEARAEATLIAQQNADLAQGRLDRILAPPNPADVAVAQADLAKAEADLEALVRSDRTQPVTQKEIDAGKAAIEAARLRLARVLAPADPTDVAAARLELARAQVELRKLVSGPSPAVLDASRQAIATAKAKLKQLLSPPLRSDVLTSRLDVRRAAAELAVLHARGGPASPTDIALARLKVDAAEARLATALLAAGPLTVRAAQAGTVTALLTTVGARVDPPTPILTMANLGSLEARVDMSEFDIAQVKGGQKASISVDALGGRSFRGEVGFAALTGTNTSGVVTFPVRVSIADAKGLKPGMNVSVRIVVATRRNVLQLPLEAVTQNGGNAATVTVLDASGQPVPRRVKLGLANNKNVEIVRGLRAGQKVVLGGASGGGEG